MARVGVWLTNYASERHLPKAIESVLNQSFSDLDLFIFDNHSPGPQVKEIIAAANDTRIHVPDVPKGLAGIPFMAYAWDVMRGLDFDYTITLGGHDYWSSTAHLDRLVHRHDAQFEAQKGNPEVALIYTPTYQVDEDDKVLGAFADIIQIGQIPRLLVPQVAVATVNTPQLFGLWNERVRRNLPIRHQCAGWDHLIVVEAALHGMILFQADTQFMMRVGGPSNAGMTEYGQRHLSKEILAQGPQDFINQLEWLSHCVDKACEDVPTEQKSTTSFALKVAIVANYFVLRGYNLFAVPGAYEAFTKDPRMIGFLQGVHHSKRMLDALIRS